jgi:hypothetical protein
MDQKEIAHLLGISVSTWFLKKDNIKEFSEAITRGREKGKLDRLSKHQSLSRRDARALEWTLERIDKIKKPTQETGVIVVGDAQKPVMVKHEHTAGDASEIIRILAESGALKPGSDTGNEPEA